MDWRNLPPLTQLRAFAAFADAPTLEQAGARIGVTHAAISQQIRALEAHLGLQLVERGGRKLVLTLEGRVLADTLEAGFGQIATAIASLTGAAQHTALRITTTPTFAAGWLMPRLSDFRAHHPDIDLTIDPVSENRDIGREADIGLRYGNGVWPGLEARLILRSSIVVVAAPSLMPDLDATGGPVDLARLAGLTWLQELGTSEVTAFFLNAQGIDRRHGGAILSMPGNLMLDAARDGQGVAVTARAFVERDIAAGRLRLLMEDDEREGYFLIHRPGPLKPAQKAFAAWALRQAEAGVGPKASA